MGLVWSLKTNAGLVRSIVAVSLLSAAFACLKWVALQFQSELFAPEIALLSDWVFEMVLAGLAGVALGWLFKFARSAGIKTSQ